MVFFHHKNVYVIIRNLKLLNIHLIVLLDIFLAPLAQRTFGTDLLDLDLRFCPSYFSLFLWRPSTIMAPKTCSVNYGLRT